ncbi:serine hydrolase domain-containing protein [Paenibacillus foliorum]|uniref:serine hydrolase domain-containing protein n=1 Tax=Paenibacillus foliorum TaxID=2654974 RepID=UPI0028AA9945|nr:serine hydrolase domain-containing protein [Paenibacillus foliorum]
MIDNKAQRLYDCLKQNIDEGINQGVFPSGIAAIHTGDQKPIIYARGFTEDTVFDLASLTKVMATLPAILLAVQSGKTSLFDPVTKWIPEFASIHDPRRMQVTLFHLLTHTSGLPAWRPYFIRLKGKEDYLAAICNEPLIYSPSTDMVYSDLGFMLLGFILERIWDMELEEVVSSLVLGPLGLHRTRYSPGASHWPIAPTEEGNPFEKNMAMLYLEDYENGRLPDGAFAMSNEDIDTNRWREGIICGTVHDCNAHYGLGGISGHAGLFSDIGDLLRYMDIWKQGSGDFLSDQTITNATLAHATSSARSRGLGWEILSNDTFGHTGFTGTSVWHNTTTETTCILLTNRVHPFVRMGIQEWRLQTRELLTSLLKGACS